VGEGRRRPAWLGEASGCTRTPVRHAASTYQAFIGWSVHCGTNTNALVDMAQFHRRPGPDAGVPRGGRIRRRRGGHRRRRGCATAEPCGRGEGRAGGEHDRVEFRRQRWKGDVAGRARRRWVAWGAGPWVGGLGGYRKVDRWRTGEKIFSFLGETLPKLRFLWSFHLFVTTQPDAWVQREGYSGSDLGEKSFQLSSLLIV
jgi:hypothetical protein